MGDASQRQQPTLVDQHDAVRDYLDALLQEIPDFEAEARAVPEPEPPAPAAPVAAEPAVEAPVSAPAPAVEPEPEPEPAPVALAEPAPEEPVTEAETEASADAAPPAADPVIEEPVARGDEAVQALFFTVGGLKLAVPLTELHSVVPRRDVEVTPMPRQPEWHMGLMRYRNRNVRVIDTVTMVLPPDKRQTEEALAAPEHILVVGDGGWGLACHAIGDVVRLRPDEVKWRKQGSQRPWLAGTVIGHLSALIDTSAFTRMLETQAPKR
ncbi:chemotaxis protein CheW [Aquisalimonas asiatica]|uniref:CheW protein n=1 Tax=Aquisalimonas asiatica TaxID=406100 RepID=A0A1H8QSK5_9GAMM|nr:chemotaxis protein CheW [Aquisalimonas asiatica]SEO56921.1 CheW protein [Aquisalimonas asiatica]